MPFSRSVIQHTRICSCIQSCQKLLQHAHTALLTFPISSGSTPRLLLSSPRNSGLPPDPQEPLTFCVHLGREGFKLLRENQFSHNSFFHSGCDNDSCRMLLKKIYIPQGFRMGRETRLRTCFKSVMICHPHQYSLHTFNNLHMAGFCSCMISKNNPGTLLLKTCLKLFLIPYIIYILLFWYIFINYYQRFTTPLNLNTQ